MTRPVRFTDPDLWPPPWNRLLAPATPTAPRVEPLVLTDADLDRHAIVYGQPGTGKSRLFTAVACHVALRRAVDPHARGLAVIDVHGDLYEDTRARLAVLAEQQPGLADHVVLIDPTNLDWTVTYNPLDCAPGEDAQQRAGNLARAVTTLFRDDPTVTNLLIRVLEHSFHALILAGATLAVFEPFLQDKEFRRAIVERVGHPRLTNYWFGEFPKNDLKAMEWARSSLNRVGRFASHPKIAPLLRAPSTVNFRDILDSGKIVLVNAPQSPLELGEDGAYLLCALILEALQEAAFARMKTARRERRAMITLCDEFIRYATDTIFQSITQTRKFNFFLWLATQEVRGRERDRDMLDGVLSTVRGIYAYPVGHQDAVILAPEMFTPDLTQVKYVREHWQRAPVLGFWEVLQRFDEPVFRDLDEIWELEARKLMLLPKGYVWYRRREEPDARLYRVPFVADIETLPAYPRLAELLQRQDEAAFRLAGRLMVAPVAFQLPAPAAMRDAPPAIPLWSDDEAGFAFLSLREWEMRWQRKGLSSNPVMA